MYEVTVFEKWNGSLAVNIYKFDDVASRDKFIDMLEDEELFFVSYKVKNIGDVAKSA
jgi:hypothetical protein